jgi:hypothetical protein
LLREFRLSPRLDGGVFCDESGAFVGAIPLLARTRGNGKDEWRPRDCDDLAQEMSALYGLPIDMSSKRGGLAVIAKALGEGDVVRAQVATVLLGIPPSSVPFQGRAFAPGNDPARKRSSQEPPSQGRLGP